MLLLRNQPLHQPVNQALLHLHNLVAHLPNSQPQNQVALQLGNQLQVRVINHPMSRQVNLQSNHPLHQVEYLPSNHPKDHLFILLFLLHSSQVLRPLAYHQFNRQILPHLILHRNPPINQLMIRVKYQAPNHPCYPQ